MKKCDLILILAFFLGISIWGMFLISVSAEEPKPCTVKKYYTCIEIQKGDSLWSIAERYKENSQMTTAEYVKELKNMNGLREDVIHSGRYLTIAYFVTGEEEREEEAAASQ